MPHEQVIQRVLPLLKTGPGWPVPPDMEVIGLVYMQPEKLGTRLVVADKTVGFDEFHFDWNGMTDYASFDGATSNNATIYDAGQGWEAIEVFIPTGDIDVGSGPGSFSFNECRISVSSPEDADPSQNGVQVPFVVEQEALLGY